MAPDRVTGVMTEIEGQYMIEGIVFSLAQLAKKAPK